MKIAVIPIDNRPVCYSLVKDIAGLDNDLELFLPDKKLLGGLCSIADVKGIFSWLEELENIDAIVVSLDTIAYGGLISSRRCKNSLEEVKLELDKFKKILSSKCKKVYAFSSIMRISNNNVNEEEKEYWDQYGKKIFEYSYKFHKECVDKSDVPKEILNDYLVTRKRNFEINKMYLEWLQEGVFDTLVFSKDDSGEYGINVLEAEILEKKIKEKKLQAQVKTGADEIPLALFARAICDYSGECNRAPKILPIFLAPDFVHLISNYEDISIEKSVMSQIELAGGGICIDEDEADIVLLVNNFEQNQGEIVMDVKTNGFLGKLNLPKKPFMTADVRFANGADNKFAGKLLKKFEQNGSIIKDFYGYSAWNTSANTLGSLICAAVVKFFAKNFNEEAFNKLQLIRFLDDWAYQANVRQNLKKMSQRPDVRKLKKLMLPYEKKLKKIFGIKSQIKYNFPWKRYFEVGIIINE